MNQKLRATLLKVITDFSCILITTILVLILNFHAGTFQRGFFCNDESIALPIRDSYVTNNILYFPGIFIPICVMIIGEYFFMMTLDEESSKKQQNRFNFRWVKLVYEKVGIFLYGITLTTFLTDAAKHTIGRLRPHFLELCKPNIDCTLSSNHYIYHENFNCTAPGLTEKMLQEVRMSFPSGHSSFITYVTIYFALYLQLRITWKGSRLLRSFLQIFCVTLAWLTALSRVSNYKHHWSDVLCGMLIGLIVSLFTFCSIGNFFNNRQQESHHSMTTEDSGSKDNGTTPTQVNILTAHSL